MAEEPLTSSDILWTCFVVAVMLFIIVPDMLGRRRGYRPLRKTGDRDDL